MSFEDVDATGARLKQDRRSIPKAQRLLTSFDRTNIAATDAAVAENNQPEAKAEAAEQDRSHRHLRRRSAAREPAS